MKTSTAEQTLTGKTALITGGSSKIGREICASLALQGVNIVVHYHRSTIQTKKLCRELRNTGVRVWSMSADFKKPDGAETLVEKCLQLAGNLDFVINNASVFTESALGRVDWSDLSLNVRVNTWAPLIISREFRRLAGKGSIVNLLDSRISGGDPAHAGYIVSKNALAALTTMTALEFAPEITVNAVAPGLIAPPMKMSGPAFRLLSKKLPLKRHGEPRDVAQAVLFLLQSTFITGQVIYVDGGRNIRELIQ
jgi:pteridine reductase